MTSIQLFGVINELLLNRASVSEIRGNLLELQRRFQSDSDALKKCARLKIEHAALKTAHFALKKEHARLKTGHAEEISHMTTAHVEEKSQMTTTQAELVESLKRKHLKKEDYLESQIRSLSLGNVHKFR